VTSDAGNRRQPGAASPDTDDPGDLGRRLTERRLALGLDRHEVALRSGIAESYLRYLERHPDAKPGVSVVRRLAGALDTSAALLQGAGIGQPPWSGQQHHGDAALDLLTTTECLEHVRGGGVGRVIFNSERGPTALPVNFGLVDDGHLVFRTASTTILDAVRARQPIGFEVDHLDDAEGEGWSVLATGHALEATETGARHEADALGVVPWAGEDRNVVVHVAIDELTGRRIRRLQTV
jgi:nitroimidazol reductase NimA-like FMN-containing flavoprotein (pyridoxamine 5'-phosphate oxidase superfamily)